MYTYILSLSDIRKILSDPTIKISAFAREAGVPDHGIRRIINGCNPRYDMVEKISEYITKKIISEKKEEKEKKE